MITTTGKDLDLFFSNPMRSFFFNDAQFSVGPCGRRSGKTHSGFNWAGLELLQGKTGLWVDTIQSNLDRYVKRYAMPFLRQINHKYWKYQSSQKILTLGDGYMDLRSAQYPENIEGFGYDFIIINEAGIVFKGQKGRDLWQQTIMPMTMDFNAIVKIIGTPKGKKAKKDERVISNAKYSLYYELAEKGKDPKNTKWDTQQYSSYENPLIPKENVDMMLAEIPPLIRRQEGYGDFLDLDGVPVFKESWFDIIDELPPRNQWHRLIMSADTAFKIGSENDDSAIVTILETSAYYLVVHVWCNKVEFPELEKTMILYHNYFYKNIKRVDFVLVEDKASGQSLVQVLRKGTRLNIEGINPDSDKYTRAVATTPICSTKNVKFLKGEWNQMFIDQLTEFNQLMDSPDDMVDAFSQGINYLVEYTKGSTR